MAYASGDVKDCLIWCDNDDKVELEYWFNVNGMQIDFREFIEENAQTEDSLDTPLRTEIFQNEIMETKRFNLAFFQDSKKLNERLASMTDRLRINLGIQVGILLLLFTLVIVLYSCWKIKKLSNKIMESIISLYETLYEVQAQRLGNEGGIIELHYKKSSKELNELQKVFIKVVKTTNIADASMYGKMTKE